jgi:hypothetical protein
MTIEEKKKILYEFTREESVHRDHVSETKPELFQTITKIDDWLTNNIANFNSYVDTTLTNTQKLKLFRMVIDGKW